ncbi:hypothetical protein JCGZ_13833 [Jatropha curcas]|uniref:Transposase MuDR plant domain-containing protein n=1 Tax=Jatropha curcas TaxID=180498 RepID=A0A067K7P4_JATCU|nr:hypothetical protein JCGZ_13833 [Jatropha curcas]
MVGQYGYGGNFKTHWLPKGSSMSDGLILIENEGTMHDMLGCGYDEDDDVHVYVEHRVDIPDITSEVHMLPTNKDMNAENQNRASNNECNAHNGSENVDSNGNGGGGEEQHENGYDLADNGEIEESSGDEEHDNVRTKKVKRTHHDPKCQAPSFMVGMVFTNAAKFKDAYIIYAIHRGVEIDFEMNEANRVRAKCTFQ